MGWNRTSHAPRGAMEPLEHRTYLAQISVTNYGATPNDGRDDVAAIRAAINASSPGDTILFPAGTYNVNDKITLKGAGRIYRGQGATIKGDPSRHIFWIREDGTRVEDFSFEGKPIMIDKPRSEKVADVVIDNNVFKINATGSDSHGITFTTGLKNSTISNNLFQGGPHAIYGYYWDKLTIANNEFIGNQRGMHLDDHSDTSRDLLIEQNYFANIRTMGIEYQGGGWNTIVQDNWYEKPWLSSVFNENLNSFAYSIIADRSHNTIARRNVIIAPERPDGTGVRIGFEIGGDNALIEDNYVSGINHVVAANDHHGTTSVLVRNNYWENIRKGPVGRGLTQHNNGSHVDLTWDISRGRPQRNVRYGESAPAPQPSPQPAPPPPQSGETYLSDLNWTSVANGWGPVEKDRSNGETGASDGRTITLNGKTYAKGLGVHAGSTIIYNLNNQYSRFFSDIGLDDEVGDNGSVTFQVFVDDQKVYDSGNMTGASATKSVNVDVSGKKTLKLVVTDSGNGNGWDHADWADARLAGASQSDPAPAPPPTGGGSTWLSDLNWSSMNNGWGPAEKNRSNGETGANDGRGLAIRNSTYTHGLGVHAGSDIRYNIGRKYSTFASDIGLDNETGGHGSVVFQIWLDGVLRYDSGTVRGNDAVKQVQLDVSGAAELRLVVTSAGDGNAYDHANWAGARLIS